LIDLADEVAYNTADLDDAFSAEMLQAEDIAACVPRYREILETVDTQFPGATPRERFYEALRYLIDILVSGLIEGTLAEAEVSGAANSAEVRAYPKRIACFTSTIAQTNRELKQFLHARVYYSPALTSARQLSAARIAELFQYFLDHPDHLPEGYREEAVREPLHRVVCGYIAAMTDSYFQRIYQQTIDSGPQKP
jgi:dGTPase